MEAYGVRTDIENVRFRNHIREVFAREKAVLDLIVNREPKYLGEKIPISGD
jgi:vancomycin permeability regulator SanA